MTRRSAFRLGLATIAVLGGIGTASAETVLLTRGDNDFGLGWLFLDGAGKCAVATPRHVIENADGQLVASDLIDSFGRQHATANPRAAEDDLDLAFLDVLGQLPAEGCTLSRLSGSSLQSLVNRMEDGILNVVMSFERQTIPVTKRATTQDEAGGAVIAVSPKDPDMPFQRGMSGGAILLSGRPMGMLFEVDTEAGLGVALRFDVIAEQYQRLGQSSAAATSAALGDFSAMTIAAGRVASADAGLSAYLAGQGALELAPEKDRAVLVVDLPTKTVVNGIRIEGDFAAGTPVIVEYSLETTGYLHAKKCELGAVTDCTFAPHRMDRIKLTFPLGEGETISLKSLAPL
jgi:hypothetical protein